MTQSIPISEIIKLTAVIVGLILSLLSIIRVIQLRNKEYATKNFVNQEIEVVNEKIKAVKDKQKDTSEDIKYIRRRLDALFNHLLDKQN